MKRAKYSQLLLLLLFFSLWGAKPDIFIVRYEDNNRAIQKDSSDWIVHRKLKNIPLTKERDVLLLSIGGEIRQQFFEVRNDNFGDGRPGSIFDERYLEQRYLLHMNLQASKRFRLFGQLTSNQITGEKDLTPTIDINDLDLAQLFVDFRADFNSRVDMMLRLGRQEVRYGSQRMIGFREGPSVRRAFDGALFQLNGRSRSFDIFYLLPVSYKMGVFDDYASRNRSVFGSYFKWTKGWKKGLELYYIGALRDEATYVDVTGEESRHSIGVRGYVGPRLKRLSLESTFQFGDFAGDDIIAYQLAFQGNYRWNRTKLKPEISLWADVFSGDLEKNDGKVNTFRAISATPVGESPFSFGTANLLSLKPSLSFSPLKRIRLKTTVNPLWRYSENDYLYVGSVTRVKRKHRRPEDSRFFATLLEGEIEYRLGKHLLLQGRVGAVRPQEYAEATGKGKPLRFGNVKLQYRF